MPLHQGRLYRTPDGHRYEATARDILSPFPRGSWTTQVEIVNLAYQTLIVDADARLLRIVLAVAQRRPFRGPLGRWFSKAIPDWRAAPLRVAHEDTGWTVYDLTDTGEDARKG
jgi:hypothetical protein